MSDKTLTKIEKTDAEWRAELSPEQYRILRQHGTERAFTGQYLNNKEPGTYACLGCGNELYRSETKYESGSGWPSFYQPIRPEAVLEVDDFSHGHRVEIRCAVCDSHQGHVFPDGPPPTGLRYCMNGTGLVFNKDEA